ncbi:Uncharacterized protein Fot_51911 [Forsythia ovata]|uniref:Uncharacterized protein n=1 Tax=Forsythia ovata TaxID=205694 RepID=A0ABD1PJ58_9LAMI
MVENANGEIGRLSAEVEQEKTKYSNTKEKLSLAGWERRFVVSKPNHVLLGFILVSNTLWESPEGETPHLCQRPLDQAGCKSRDVYEWQGPEGESQQVNPQDRPPQYFSENLSHTEIEPALPEDFSPRHLKPYQLAYAPGEEF